MARARKARKAGRAKSTGGGKKWIQEAIKRPGALTRKAKAAGMTTMAYARAHRHSPGTTGKQARLALTLQRLPRHKGPR